MDAGNLTGLLRGNQAIVFVHCALQKEEPREMRGG